MPNVDIWSSLVVGFSIHWLLFFISFLFYSFSNQCVECWYAHFVPIEYYYCCNYFPHVFKRCNFTTSTTRTINRNEKNCEKKWKDIYFYADFCDFLYFHLFFCHPFSIVWIHCICDIWYVRKRIVHRITSHKNWYVLRWFEACNQKSTNHKKNLNNWSYLTHQSVQYEHRRHLVFK